METSFKTCSMCGVVWPDRERFLADPALEMIGYQAVIDNPESGLFLFNHLMDDCKSTIAVQVSQFRDLYDGPVYQECLYGTDQCAGLCLYLDNLKPCPAECACRYIRDLLQIVKNWKKKSAAG